MDMPTDLFRLADAFGSQRGIGEARVSTLVFNDGKRLRSLRDGADMGYQSIARAIQYFSDHWPDGLDWPSDIERPARSAVAA